MESVTAGVGYGHCGLLAGLRIGGAAYCTGGVVTVRLVTSVVVYWRGCLLVGRVTVLVASITVLLVTGVVVYWRGCLLVGRVTVQEPV